MKKALYSLMLCVMFVSCSEKETITPERQLFVTPDDIIGTWETYLFMKKVEIIGNGGNQFKQELRYTDYDGFRTRYRKEGSKYIFESYNALGNKIDDDKGGLGTYEIIDSAKVQWIKHYWKTSLGKDTITKQKITDLEKEKGILKIADIYNGTTHEGGKYTITDGKLSREVTIAPYTTEYVNPAKVMVDFNDLCQGTWEIYRILLYINNDLDRSSSETETKRQSGRTFKFYTREDGQKRVLWKLYPAQIEPYDSPVVLRDDVVHLLYKEEEEDGTLKDSGSYFWVTDRKNREGYDSFIDLKLDRDSKDVSLTIREDRYIRRIPDK